MREFFLKPLPSFDNFKLSSIFTMLPGSLFG